MVSILPLYLPSIKVEDPEFGAHIFSRNPVNFEGVRSLGIGN